MKQQIYAGIVPRDECEKTELFQIQIRPERYINRGRASKIYDSIEVRKNRANAAGWTATRNIKDEWDYELNNGQLVIKGKLTTVESLEAEIIEAFRQGVEEALKEMDYGKRNR